MIEVYPIGSAVTIDGDISAYIKRVCIENESGDITYECVWWDERKRVLEWLPAREITPKDPNRKTQISLT